MRHSILYTADADSHMRLLTAYQRATVLSTVERELAHEPTGETRNRKPMRPNPIAPWELRIGNLRVYYRVDSDREPTVVVVAVGVKVGNRVWIGNEEIVT